MDGKITEFMKRNFKHFNAATVVDAAEGYRQLINSSGKMTQIVVTVAR